MGGPSLPCYLWQMPLNTGCSLQPIHGRCGMRLPHWFWPALPKLLEGAFSPSLEPLEQRPPKLGCKTRLSCDRAPFGLFVLHNSRSVPSHSSGVFDFHFTLPLSPLALPAHPTASHSPQFPLFVAACCNTDWFSPVQHSRWESTWLYLCAAEVLTRFMFGIFCLGLPAHTCTPCLHLLIYFEKG